MSVIAHCIIDYRHSLSLSLILMSFDDFLPSKSAIFIVRKLHGQTDGCSDGRSKLYKRVCKHSFMGPSTHIVFSTAVLALWSRITQNPDVSAWPLLATRSNHSLICMLCPAGFARALPCACLLAYSLARSLAAVLNHSAWND